MVFGKKELFAIEAELSQSGEYIFINYCFWIKKYMIGDNMQTALLQSAIDMTFTVSDKKGKRNIDNTDLVPPVDITNYFITFLLSGENELCKNQKSVHIVDDLCNFNIASYHDECFQGFFVFLIEGIGYDWILCKDEALDKYVNLKVPKNSIYNCFEDFSKWINHSTILVLRSFFTTQNSNT